jgi:hypothetical protein
MSDTTPAYSLLPWVRRGVASLIAGVPSVNYATLPVSLAVNGTAVAAPPNVRLPGPGDVQNIDPRAFIRTEPRDGADRFEPNYLAAVELATPDLPWMFTPAAPVGDRLMPWLCLIVLPDTEGVTLIPQANGPATLRLDAPLDPAKELPDLSQIDAWVHAQIAGSDLSAAALAGDSGASLSRLIAPRKLVALQRYIACVVPTYRAGLNAGLGLPVTDNDLSPAWDATITSPFSLPVYFQFSFQTGPDGDFASLAHKIGPPQVPIAVGTRTMDVSQPGFGAAPAPGVTLGLEGALRTFNMQPTAWPAGAQAAFETQLRGALMPAAAVDPVVSPPVFGRTQTGQDLPAAGQPPVWLGELNLDPRSRTVASAGGQVVQADADSMVASAWSQLGEIRKANQLLRQAQLAREVSASLNQRHLQTMDGDGTYLQITSPVHGRVSLTLAGVTATLMGHVAASRLPSGAVSAPLRKLARPRGPLGRQLAVTGPQQIVDRLNIPVGAGATALVVAGPVKAPQGMVALDDVSPAIQMVKMTAVSLQGAVGWQMTAVATTGTTAVSETLHVSALALPAAKPEIAATPVTPITPIKAVVEPVKPILGSATSVVATSVVATSQLLPLIDWKADPNVPAILQVGRSSLPAPFVFPTDTAALATMQQNFSTAAAAINGYLNAAQPSIADLPSLGGAPALSSTRALLSARLDPAVTIPTRLKVRLPLGTGSDPLQPLTGTPLFPQAMFAPLADLSPEWMLPGISSIPIDTAVLLQTNPRFVEAFLVGLNEEFSRELLWRQFPAERADTWFQNFWSSGGTADIAPIAQFDPAGHLGDHTQDQATAGRIALLIRADLFQRYPNTLVSAVQAVWNPDGLTRALGTARQWPIFQGQIGADYRFFGFDIVDPFGVADPTAKNPGWYFVLEEHVTEPRFGLEPTTEVGSAAAQSGLSWNDLSWEDVGEGGGLSGDFLTTTSPPKFTSIEPVAWGDNAAAMAFILMRRPTRVAMHANALLAGQTT